MSVHSRSHDNQCGRTRTRLFYQCSKNKLVQQNHWIVSFLKSKHNIMHHGQFEHIFTKSSEHFMQSIKNLKYYFIFKFLHASQNILEGGAVLNDRGHKEF